MLLWNDIEGNEAQKAVLRRAALTESFGNAYLFVGPEGSGRHSLARCFISAVLCEKHGPCGECRACRLIDKDIHPDVYRPVLPDDKKVFPVEAVRGVIKESYSSPTESEHRFILFDDASALSVQSQNALLLTLEEPPAKTVFIIFATRTDELISTVLSRCAVIHTELIFPEKIAALLGGGEKAEQAARLSGGVIGAAKKYIENPPDCTTASELLRCFAMKSPFQAYEKFMSLALNDRDEIRTAAEQLVGAARDLAVYSATGNINDTNFFQDGRLIEKASAVLGTSGLYRLAAAADETARYASMSCNAKLLAENLFFKGWECFNG